MNSIFSTTISDKIALVDMDGRIVRLTQHLNTQLNSEKNTYQLVEVQGKSLNKAHLNQTCLRY